MTKSPLANTLPLNARPCQGEFLTTQQPHLFLVVDAGRPCRGAARVCLDGIREIVFGRGVPTSTTDAGVGRVVVAVDDDHMSRAHATIERRRDSGWQILDRGSRNCTLIHTAGEGTRRVRTDIPDVLLDGDWIEMGQTLLRFRALVDCAPAGPRMLAILPDDSCLSSILPALQLQFAEVAAIAQHPFGAVLIKGETGTGKELLARALHSLSPRSAQEFVSVNCGALVREHARAELFGIEKDSYTDVKPKQGFVRRSRRGTLFLDEIGKLPVDVQDLLFRVLEQGEIQAVGADRIETIPRDELNVVFAANEDLGQLVQRDRFRADLHARIGTSVIELPALRDRWEDLGLILAQLLHHLASERIVNRSVEEVVFTVESIRTIILGDWPWNIRGLRDALRATLMRTSSLEIGAREFEKSLRLQSGVAGASGASKSAEGGGRRVRTDAPSSINDEPSSGPVRGSSEPPVLNEEQQKLRNAILARYAKIVLEQGKYRGAKTAVAKAFNYPAVNLFCKLEQRLHIKESDYLEAVRALQRELRDSDNLSDGVPQDEAGDTESG